VWQQDFPRARALAEQSLAHFREVGDIFYSSAPLGLLGLIHLEQGELVAARPLLSESLTIGKQTGIESDKVEHTIGLARLSALEGDVATARRLYHEGLTLLFACKIYKEQIAASLEGLATLETGQGEPLQAARLWGAAEALREAVSAPLYPIHRVSYEQAVAHTRAQLREQAFRAAWNEGRLLTPQQALAAQGQVPLPTARPTRAEASPTLRSLSFPAGLTAREVEVLRLLSQGWTDAQIAAQLVISPRTVNHHTTSLYSKLAVSSRAAATRYALEHHLL
jgi:DNA-binding CsgD family transcriptional regulator